MSKATELQNKLKQHPAVRPEADEIEAILDYQAQKASGDLELISFEKTKERISKANGRISLRVPRQLHIDLIEAAEKQGVSLNQYISYVLASNTR